MEMMKKLKASQEWLKTSQDSKLEETKAIQISQDQLEAKLCKPVKTLSQKTNQGPVTKCDKGNEKQNGKSPGNCTELTKRS